MTRKQAIDTHVHFWRIEHYGPFKGWFGDKTFLERNYLPADLEPYLATCNAQSAIIVGAAPDSHAENLWYADLAEQHESVHAVVGSYTFQNEKLAECLDAFADRPSFVGIRARPASPPDLWLEDRNAKAGMTELRKHGLTLDMLVDHTMLPAVTNFAAAHHDVSFIVNHCGLPPFRDGDLSLWQKNIRALATVPNVMMKYSSFFLHSYPFEDETLLYQAADLLFETFGVERLLWGSNWPPELVGGTYQEAYELMLRCAGNLSDTEYNLVFRENAERVYSR